MGHTTATTHTHVISLSEANQESAAIREPARRQFRMGANLASFGGTGVRFSVTDSRKYVANAVGRASKFQNE